MVDTNYKQFDDGTFGFDYTLNLPTNILNTYTTELDVDIPNNVYLFGYQFNSDIDDKTKSEFIDYLNGSDDCSEMITANEVIQFIELPLGILQKKINLYKLNSFIFPNSNRSKLTQASIEVILSMTAHGLNYLPIESFKYLFKYNDFSDLAIKLKGKNVLMLIDKTISNSKINEVLRVMSKINSDCDIYIFTLIGKADKDGGVISYV